jgi:hypothetical protein
MAKISTYKLDNSISGDDKVIGTDADNINETKNFKISDLSNYIINQITPFEGYLDVVTPDSYVGTRLTPKTGYKSGFWIDHNSNSSVGFGAKNTNTGNIAVASIGVNSKIGNYESGISIFSASENYFKTEFRDKGVLYSPNDLGLYTINNNDFIWYTSTGDYYDTVNERMSLSNNGYLKLNSYGSGSVTGTVAKNLAVDSSGNVIETSGNIIDGSGTANYLPVWTDANTLGNSAIYQDSNGHGGVGVVGDLHIPNGNVRIGTTSPTNYTLDVVNTNDGTTGIRPFRVSAQANVGTVAIFENTSGINTHLKISDTIDDMYVVSRNGIMGLGSSDGWSSKNLNITSYGWVGIGNRNPSERLHVKGGSMRIEGGRIDFYKNTNDQAGYIGGYSDDSLFPIASSYKIVFKTGSNYDEKMRLTDDGRLLLNTPDNAAAANSRFETIGNSADPTTNLTFKTSGRIGLGDYNPDAKITVVGATNTTTSNLVKIQNTSDTGSVIDFRNSVGTQAGKISMPSSTTVNYGTTSDYRLKTNVVTLENGINRVKKLKPSRFEWIDSDAEVDGFIAHEVAEVIPEAIDGEKDAVDENNNPIYQTIDQSKIIPVLTAALKEAIQKIESLETRIQKLENN